MERKYIFFIDWSSCLENFLHGLSFSGKKKPILLHIFHTSTTTAELTKLKTSLETNIPEEDKFITLHQTHTEHENAVQNYLAYFVAKEAFSSSQHSEVFLVSSGNRSYEELARILRSDTELSAWATDGNLVTLVDLLDPGIVCRSCKILFSSAYETNCHYEKMHFEVDGLGTFTGVSENSQT